MIHMDPGHLSVLACPTFLPYRSPIPFTISTVGTWNSEPFLASGSVQCARVFHVHI